VIDSQKVGYEQVSGMPEPVDGILGMSRATTSREYERGPLSQSRWLKQVSCNTMPSLFIWQTFQDQIVTLSSISTDLWSTI
jgi:hypothetical protein